MNLGFVSAILADQTPDEVLDFAAAEGFSCVELMCRPVGKADRRYAGLSRGPTLAGVSSMMRRD